MEKTSQIPCVYRGSAQERLEAADSALFEVNEAMESLKGFYEFAEIFSTLSDVYDDIWQHYTKLEVEAAGEHQDMIDELRREYYRGAL